MNWKKSIGIGMALTLSLLLPACSPSETVSEPPANSIAYVDLNAIRPEEGEYELYIAVSYVKDEEQRLTGDLGWYSLAKLDALEGVPEANTLMTRNNGVAYSGNWNFFPVSVKHQQYTFDKQPKQEEWNAYFAASLAETSPDTPVVIAESWTFEWNGMEAAVVTASNVIQTGDASVQYTEGEGHAAPNPPAGDTTVMYRMSALFTTGNEPLELYRMTTEVSKAAVGSPTENAGGVSYLPAADASSYQQVFTAIQTDAGGSRIECPVFHNSNGEFRVRDFNFFPDYLVCDTDGNGEVELVAYMEKTSSSMSRCAVFRLVEGVPEKTLSVIPY